MGIDPSTLPTSPIWAEAEREFAQQQLVLSVVNQSEDTEEKGKKTFGMFGGGRTHKFNVSAPEDRTLDGIIFDSKMEGKMYNWLKEHLPPGVVVQRQVPFLLQDKFRDQQGVLHRPIRYVADFLVNAVRIDELAQVPDGAFVIDTKGMETPDFKIKKKLMLYKFPCLFYTPKSLKQLAEIPWASIGIHIDGHTNNKSGRARGRSKKRAVADHGV